MASEILVTPAELRDQSAAIKSQATDTRTAFEQLKNRLQPLQSQFKGRAAEAFDQHFMEWHTHAVGLIEALEGLGGFLDNAAATIEDVDSQLASGLNG